MKSKKTSRILTGLLAVALVVSLANGALAARTLAAPTGVTFYQTEGFVINAANEDLFQDFKGVMPGDVLTQTVTVNAAESNTEDRKSVV